MRVVIVLVALIVMLSVGSFCASAFGQTVAGDRVRLNTGPCVITSQAGPPVRLVFTGTCDGLTNGSGNFELDPVGDLVFDPTGNDVLPFSVYDINLGSLQKKFLALHAAELWVETLVAQNTIATIGGRVLVAPTNLLTLDLAAATTTITVKYNNFANGDRAYMEADGKVEFFAITSGAGGSAGAYTYTVTRNLDGTGANDWFAGDAMLNTGTTGNGFIDLYSVRGVKAGTEIGPTIVGNVRNSATYNDWSPRWAVGNLDGLYGYSGSTYGTAFGNAAATNVTIDATNGFRIRTATTNVFHADTNGDLTLGIPSGAGLEWDQSAGTLTVRGTGGSSTNMIQNTDCAASTGGWTTFSSTGIASFGIGLDPYDLNNTAGTCYIVEAGTPANATDSYYQTTTPFPVVAGNRYEASVYLGVHGTGTNAIVWVVFLDSSASVTGSLFGNSCEGSGQLGGYYLEDYCRSGVVGAAPANSVQAIVRIYRSYNGAQLNPATFFAHAFLGEATSTQTELSPWGPPGQTVITGDLIQTGTILATHINVSTLSAISANIGTVTAGTITGVSITTTTGTIGGFTLGATTITGGDLVLSNTGNITVGTGNNVARMSDDGTIRFWAGNATAGSAPFQVTQAGAVTASDITITGGSVTLGTVTLDSSGLSLIGGSSSTNKIKWSDGSTIYSDGDLMYHTASIGVGLTTNGSTIVQWDGTAWQTNTANDDIGTSSSVWRYGYFADARVTSGGGGGTRHACFDNDGDLVVCP